MKKKKILVSGGAGFIGSHLCDRLVEEDFEVHAVDNLSKGKIENLNKKVDFIKININSPKFLKLQETLKPNTIFHLAAQSSISNSLKDPRKDFQTNFFSTLKLLERSRQIKIGKIIFASSAAIFGKVEKLPIDEDYPKNPISYYGISKLCSEYFFKNYFAQYKLPYVILRLANVYGPRQDASGEGGVVAIFANQIQKKRPVTIFGNGNQTRDFVYVSDVVDALIKSIQKDVIGEFNIGTSKQVSVNKLLEMLLKIDKGNKAIDKIYSERKTPAFMAVMKRILSEDQNTTAFKPCVVYKPSRFFEAEKSSLSSEKFKIATGFVPQVDIQAGLEKTYQYLLKPSNL